MPGREWTEGELPQLRRVLGTWDLTLLFVVAVANLNLVPEVATGGAVTIWLWLLALALFFWPQGIAVIELSHRYPGEGGVYLWTKELFGDFHGFLSGWFYWTNNVFYIPTLLLYLVGISVYVGGPRVQALGNNSKFVFLVAAVLLVAMVILNVFGLGVSRWVNNLGALGTGVTAIALVGLAAWSFHAHGSHLTSADFRPAGADWRMLSQFGVICFGLVGLELGSVMGDEIHNPKHTVPRAVVWGGVLSGALYLSATLGVLLALPRAQIGAVQGILQALSSLSFSAGVGWLVPILALLLTLAVAGTTSAWLSGSARIPFVAGLDHYLPPALGRLHSKYATPAVALVTHAVFSGIFMVMSIAGATVVQAYQTLLLLAVVLQLVPFLYMYAGLLRIAGGAGGPDGFYRKRTLWLAGLSGLLTTSLGMILAFLPQVNGESAWAFEIKMIAGCVFFTGLAAFFFFVYSRRAPLRTAGGE